MARLTLNPVENLDETEMHEKECCENGEAPLKGIEVSGVEERQVFYMPAMKGVVTAHQASLKICPECQTENKGDFPENVNKPVQYGDGVKTVASYFNSENFMPVARTAQFLKDLYGQAPSEAVILKANKELNQHIQSARSAVKQQLYEVPVLHSDKTGLRVEGK